MWSTTESERAGEVTYASIVETLIAIGLSVLVALHFRTLRFIAISAVLAPFLLLRTPVSTRRGLRIGTTLVTALHRAFFTKVKSRLLAVLFAPVRAPGVLLMGVLVGVAGALARTLSTGVTLGTHPRLSLTAIPGNWRRVVLCVDVRCPVGVVPGIDDPEHLGVDREPLREFTLSAAWRSLRRFRGQSTTVVRVLAIPLLFVPLFLPALLYRWSLKATAIIYSPLLWVVRPLLPPKATLEQRVRLTLTSDLMRVAFWFSVIVLLSFAAKMWFFITWGGFAEWWNSSTGGQLLSIYVEPAIIPIWQIAMVANALLAVALHLFLRSAVRHMDQGVPYSDKLTSGTLTTLTVLRRTLSTYTIACTLYITVRAATEWNWPELGSKVVPWAG